ncbi:MAG: chemotaxis protein CheC [Candidatus Kapabacteria bacterium]|nr:chemotaxis protein CheC [Candidatus Kapabacteria bacterium]
MFNEIQRDAFREIVNMGVGKAANLLNTIIGHHIHLNVPNLRIIKNENLDENFYGTNVNLSAVNLAFNGFINGACKLIFPTGSASKLVSLFTNEESDLEDFDAIRVGTLSEIGNIVLNSLIGTLCNQLKVNLSFTVPTYKEGFVKELFETSSPEDNSILILAGTTFIIEEINISGDFVLIVELGSLQLFKDLIDKYVGEL